MLDDVDGLEAMNISIMSGFFLLYFIQCLQIKFSIKCTMETQT